jgi:hypothetical protein
MNVGIAISVIKYKIKPHPLPLSLLRRGEIKHSFVGVRFYI